MRVGREEKKKEVESRVSDNAVQRNKGNCTINESQNRNTKNAYVQNKLSTGESSDISSALHSAGRALVLAGPCAIEAP